MKNKLNTSLSLRKVILSAMVAAPLATLPAPLWALPVAGANLTKPATTIVVGPLDPGGIANTLSITDNTTNRLVLKWNEFGAGGSLINAVDTVRWNLAGPSAAVLNLVTGALGTQVDGTLASNGQVLIVNPNGITLSGTAVVNTAGLTLSSIPEPEFAFLTNGALGFSGTATNSVAVQGSTINVGSTGNVLLAGKTVDVAGTINAGLLTVNTQNGAANLAAGGPLNVGGPSAANPTPGGPVIPGWGNVTVNSGTGTVNISANAVTVNGGTLTINTTGAAVTQAPAGSILIGDADGEGALNVNTGTGALTLTGVAAANNKRLNVTLTTGTTNISQAALSTGDLRLQASTINSSAGAGAGLTVNGGLGSITRGADIAIVGSNKTISGTTSGLSKNIEFATTGGDIIYSTLNVGGAAANGNIKVTSRDGSIQLPGVTVGTLTVSAANNITQSGAINSVVTGTQVVSVNAAPTGNGQVTGLSNFGTQLWSAVPTVTLVDPVGVTTSANLLLTLNTNNSGALALQAFTAGASTRGAGYTAAPTATLPGGTVIAGGSSGTHTFDATTGTITLAHTNNNFGVVVLKNAPGGLELNDAQANLNIGNGTNVLGAATLRVGGDLVFGGLADATAVTAADTVRFGSTLSVTPSIANVTTATVSDKINNLVVEGAVNITTTGTVALDGAFNNGVALGHRFGQLNITTTNSAARVYETTTLNLGTVNTGSGQLRVYSSTGDIIQSGQIIAGAVYAGAGSGFAPGNVTLTNATNAIGGAVTVLDDFTLLANTAAPGTGGDPIGTLLARNVTLVNNANLALGGMTSSGLTGIAGNLDVTVTGGTNAIAAASAMAVAGTVTLNAPGAVTMNNADNRFTNATVTAGGATDIRSLLTWTVNANLSGTGGATFRSGDVLRIGTIRSSTTGQIDFVTDGGSDAAGSIVDTTAGISIYGNVFFNSGGGVTVNRAGHSFGRVQVTTRANRAATIVENGTLRLGAISINGTGSFTATSTTGDIIQDPSTNGVRLGNGNSGTANFNATRGNVLLDDATGNTNQVRRININSGGNVVFNNSLGNVTTLGNITAGGTFAVTSLWGIEQLSGSRLNVYGTTTFNASDTPGVPGDITIANAGNRMGGIVATTGSGNITLNEGPTLNLKSITTTGALSATSETGSVIDSADALVVNNRIAAGATSLSAVNGSILLNLSSDYSALSLNTGGNASVIDTGGNLSLGASTVGGTLDVVSTVNGNLSQTGALNVGGNVTLSVGNGSIDLSNSANQLGAIRFTANNVAIAEATTLNLRAGSVGMGGVSFSTGGDFVTSGTGASSFTSQAGGLTISAPNGSIIPGAGSLFVLGNFTVFSNVLKDLSALSKSGNLGNRDPINLGSGTYTPPAP